MPLPNVGVKLRLLELTSTCEEVAELQDVTTELLCDPHFRAMLLVVSGISTPLPGAGAAGQD